MSNVKWFWLFLKTRSNWIFWIIFLQFVFLGMAYIDYDMAIESVAYIVLLNICLLYTSPSPRDKRQSRMPSSA